jgi:hypothetical protein
MVMPLVTRAAFSEHNPEIIDILSPFHLYLGTSSMAETGSPRGTKVTFLDQTGSKSIEAVVSDTVTVQKILPSIISKMNLPIVGPDGQPMSYSLDHKQGGRRLHESETLVAARVNDGDHLIIYPEIVAG